MQTTVIRAGLVCPCKIEYDRCKADLGLAEERLLAGRKVSTRNKGGVEVAALQAGPGKIQCASAAQLLIDRHELDFIIDVGAAGSLSGEIKIHDIICASSSIEYDVCANDYDNIEAELITSTVLAEKPLYREIIKDLSRRVNLKIEIGSIASGENNVNNSKLRRTLYEKLGAVAANWETSAVLKTAELNQVRAFSFRVITDNADSEMEETLFLNWTQGLDTLYKVLDGFLSYRWLKGFMGS